jgi:hypothetical protein
VEVGAGEDAVDEELGEDSLALAGALESDEAAALLSDGADSEVESDLGSELLEA